MSAPKVRRKGVARTALLVAAAGLIAATLAAADATPVAVKASSRNEQAPAASADWFAWSKSRSAQTSPSDVWAQHGSERAFKVNARRTLLGSYAGGIDGDRLVYQRIVDIDRADLRLYDLARRRLLALPASVNTKRWECCATLSGDWLLFTRGSPETRQLQLVLLQNLVTGERRTLDHLRNPRGALTAGQISGGFAVWSRCNPYPRCTILRYDVLAQTTAPLSAPSGKVVYGPSVGANGTAYYLRSNRGCGRAVELVKEPLLGASEVLFAFPAGQDGQVTYALGLTPRPPGELVTTRIYYDRLLCRTKRWDIFRVDDVQRAPPPVLGS